MRILHFSILFMLRMMFWNFPCFAQNAGVKAKQPFVEPYKLQITTNKTTNLIFPYSIKSVDRGSADLLAQAAKGIDNVLQLKAAKESFTETNLTVITSDGNLYSFQVNYDRQPSRLTIQLSADTLHESKETTPKAVVSLNEDGTTEANMISTANRLLSNRKRTVNGVKDKRYKMKLRLQRIYVDGEIMYFQLDRKNSSNINYDIDMLSFFVRDQKRAKRTAVQELEIKPLCVAGNTTLIKGKSKSICVFAIPKLTLPDAKYLAIEMTERNGGRSLLLKVHNRHIVYASVIRGS